MKPAITRFIKKCQPQPNGCIVWRGWKDGDGYGQFWYQDVYHGAHRWIYQYVHNKILPKDIFVCHTCDNPGCVNWEHLWEGTIADNNIDRHHKGRSGDFKGIKNGRAKITETEAKEIRTSKLKISQLCKKYNLHRSTIHDIKNKKLWKHI